jgi:glycosyltransferase involved in cell wall biosynthesis
MEPEEGRGGWKEVLGYMPPKVSVVMPSYKGGEYIGKSIESILDQSFTDLELIIVHQPSGDDTLEVISRFDDERIQVVEKEEPGFASASNMGLDNATGEYVAIQDDDDIAVEGRIEAQVAYLDEHPEVDLVCSTFMYIDRDGNRLLEEPANVYDGSLPPFEYLYLVENFIPNDSVMYRRTDLRYDETIPSAVDVNFFLRFLHASNRVYQFPEPMVLVRRKEWHTSSRYQVRDKLHHRIRIRREIRRMFDLPLSMYIKALSKEYLSAALEYYNLDKLLFVRYMLLSFVHNPLNPRLYSRSVNKLRQRFGSKGRTYADLARENE